MGRLLVICAYAMITEISRPYILADKRKATVEFCHALHVAHKHELHKLTMNRILSQSSGLS